MVLDSPCQSLLVTKPIIAFPAIYHMSLFTIVTAKEVEHFMAECFYFAKRESPGELQIEIRI